MELLWDRSSCLPSSSLGPCQETQQPQMLSQVFPNLLTAGLNCTAGVQGKGIAAHPGLMQPTVCDTAAEPAPDQGEFMARSLSSDFQC
jgi:hypothetical protein